MKSAGVAYLLWCACFLGISGLHRFYLEKPGSAILMMVSCGGCFWWDLIDLFLIPEMVNQMNRSWRRDRY